MILTKKMNGKSKENLKKFKKDIEEKIKILEGLDNDIDILILKRNRLLSEIETSIIIFRKFKYNK